nr:hypothetical protein [Deinococcus sp. Arct2-2]
MGPSLQPMTAPSAAAQAALHDPELGALHPELSSALPDALGALIQGLCCASARCPPSLVNPRPEQGGLEALDGTARRALRAASVPGQTGQLQPSPGTPIAPLEQRRWTRTPLPPGPAPPGRRRAAAFLRTALSR